MSAQFLHNNLVKFCCARLNIFKLCVLKTLILKRFDRYDLPIVVRSLKRIIKKAQVVSFSYTINLSKYSNSCSLEYFLSFLNHSIPVLTIAPK